MGGRAGVEGGGGAGDGGGEVVGQAGNVRERLDDIIADEDLSRYIL